MEFNREKRHILEAMGISDFDVNRYMDIDEKLKTYRAAREVRFEVERIDLKESAETHSALVNTVREQIERSMQPLRTAVDEIKASVSRELEEERFLLRNHLAAAQKEIIAQLEEIRHIQDQQLNQSGPCHHHQPDKGIQAEEIKAQEQGAARQFEPKIPTEGKQARIRATEERGDVKNHDQQMLDTSSDLLWFKEQVQSLQYEHKQYRQELRRQEQQQLLQYRVSVSKLELKKELGRTKDEIITSMKALWAFTEAELNDSSKWLNEKTTEAVCDLSRCQEETKKTTEILTSELKAVRQLVVETIENVSPNLLKNQVYKTVGETKQMLAEILATTSDTQDQTKENASELQKVNQILEETKEIGLIKHVENLNTALEHSDLSKTLHNLEGKLDDIQRRVESDTISVHENALRDLQMVFVGQAQRIIQKMVNPSSDPCNLFHFYIKNFHQLEGSGKTVFSLPYVVPIDNSLFAVHLVAHFKTQTSEMILGLVCPADPRELGLEYLGSPLLELIINSGVVGRDGHEDILVARDKVIDTHTFLKHTNDNYLQMGESISCPELVSSGYNSFKDRSVLIKLQIRLIENYDIARLTLTF
ncbi:hypothetical protein PoB_007573200 [Plakobranchus ocellatus]|uniref:C1q domain-containing protein n=1 Tax=Plakobranchus ocellatus TaxID=259542 RepID=A0AAV4DY29_9GAST|nr:hypothetical protein PoB_007573200 [Plakobranchus ocellatus]